MQGKFDEHLAQWNAVIKNLAELDCHLSLLLAKENMGDPMCTATSTLSLDRFSRFLQRY